ncbi:DUF3164 family protein [Rhizobium sp. Leaf341]|uniref:DUF3164 family protein n=1 Tax=Rhizobium sp. Leaf341 TaxID=1736344 RepID=UPI0007125D52|nr:DUF3164 family protein [Rhizobium sp. Leaf341]KQR75768.1 sulfate transporter [Rhizobium sp. Leaf341]
MDAVILEERSDGVIAINGRDFMVDAKGSYVPLSMVKPQHKLEDEIVRKIMSFAVSLNEQIGRFRGHTMTDLGDYDALIAQEYNAKVGGAKGNRTYQTFDGLMKVQVQVQELIDFGSELHIAKSLIDECLNEWSSDSRPEIQSIVTRAFNTDSEGKINRSEIFMLMRHEIEDPRWKRAMDAIRDAMRVTGSKQYVRFYRREKLTDEFRAVTIDMAKA